MKTLVAGLLAMSACAAASQAQTVSQRLFVSDWDTNSVYEFNAATGALVNTLLPQMADNAIAMAGMTIGPDSTLYLTDFNTDAVRRYNIDTGALLGTFVPQNSGGLDNSTALTFGPDGHLYAANGDTGGVLRFNGSNGAFMNTFIPTTECAASRFVLFHNGSVYVTDHFATSVKKFDAATGALQMTFACCAPEGRGIALTSWGELLVASWENRSIERFDINTGARLGKLVTDIRANGILMGPDGYLYAGEAVRHQIEKYDPHTGNLITIMGAGLLMDPWQLAFAPVNRCVADFNNDGVADFFDYLDFVGAFASNEPGADFNQDSVIDFFDYLDFLSAFTAGC